MFLRDKVGGGRDIYVKSYLIVNIMDKIDNEDSGKVESLWLELQREVKKEEVCYMLSNYRKEEEIYLLSELKMSGRQGQCYNYRGPQLS